MTRSVPVVVGALTAETAGAIAFTSDVYQREGQVPYQPAALGGTVVAGEARLEVTGGEVSLIITFQEPVSVPAEVFAVSVGAELVPSGYGTFSAPVRVEVGLQNGPDGLVIPEHGDVRLAGSLLGSVPVAGNSTEIRFALSNWTSGGGPIPAVPSGRQPGQTVEVGGVALSGVGILGVDDRMFRVRVNFDRVDIDQLFEETVVVQLSGVGIALTRESTGTTAVGHVDPISGLFVAENENEYWSGFVAGGLVGTYSVIEGSTPDVVVGRSVQLPDPLGLSRAIEDAIERVQRAVPRPPDAYPQRWHKFSFIDSAGQVVVQQAPLPADYVTPDELNSLDFETNLEFGQAVSRMQRSRCAGSSEATARLMAREAPSLRLLLAQGERVPARAASHLTLDGFDERWLVCPFIIVGTAQAGAPCRAAAELADPTALGRSDDGAAADESPGRDSGDRSGSSNVGLVVILVALVIAVAAGVSRRRRGGGGPAGPD